MKAHNQATRTTKMMDNLYLDKLKGRITESEYDKFYTSLCDQMPKILLSDLSNYKKPKITIILLQNTFWICHPSL